MSFRKSVITFCAAATLYSRNYTFLIGLYLTQLRNSHFSINQKAYALAEDIWASLQTSQNTNLEKYKIIPYVVVRCRFQKSASAPEHTEKIMQEGKQEKSMKYSQDLVDRRDA